MKICPTCRKTYEDDGLNFCLDDGSVLTFAPIDAAPTVVMDHPRPTNPTRAPNQSFPAEWNPQQPSGHSMQPRKKSRAWLWVLGIFAILILVCGGGAAGAFFYVASIANTNTIANKGTNTTTSNKGNTFTRVSPSPGSSIEKGEVSEVDLSGWVEDPTEWLATDFADGEFFMTSKKTGYYYVLVAKNSDYSGTRGAKVTVRNADDADASMGYGLVFNSDTTPLTNDYAFLIDTKKKKYRVVRHQSEQEKTVTAWTASNLIKQGREANLLESRISGDKIELYINGQLATTVTNKQGPKSGVPGLYVGDGAKIGFKNLEVVK